MAPTPEGVDVLSCPDCGAAIVPKGKQSAAMALGYHRWQAHGVKGTHRERSVKRRAAKARAAEAAPPEEASTPLAVVHSITEPIGGKGAPTHGQLTAALGKAYGYGQLWRASRLVEADPRLTDDQRVEMIERLAPGEQTCEAVASPFARVIARTGLNKTAGRQIVDNIDILDCFVAVLETERTLAAYAREVKAVKAGQATGAVITMAPSGAPGPVIPAGAQADYYAEAGGPRSPEPQEGRVISAEDVAASLGATITIPPDVNIGAGTEMPPPSMEVTE